MKIEHKARWEIINALIDLFGYRTYLEIGVDQGVCFHQVKADYKVSVDPVAEIATIKATSDHFFAHYNMEFDIIFIDGLHERDQVLRDFHNSLNTLTKAGTIVVHDCNPVTKGDTVFIASGTVWEAWAHYRMYRPDLSMAVLNVDHGCGIIRRGNQELLPPMEEMPFEYFNKNRIKVLNLVPPIWPDWFANNFL